MVVNFCVKVKMNLVVHESSRCSPKKVKYLILVIFKPTHKGEFMGKFYENFQVCLTILSVLSSSKGS